MRMNPSQDWSVQFRVLSDDQINRIVLAAYEVLARIGAHMYEPKAVEILAKAGCVVIDGRTVRFPAKLIKEALNTVPASFTLYTRHGMPAIQVEPNRAYFGPGPTCCNYVDPGTGKRRPFVKNDAALTARVCDALPNIDYVMSLGNVNDHEPEKADIHEFDAMVRETTKPIMTWSFGLDGLKRIHEMCIAVKGSTKAYAREPFMIHYAEPSSPLKHSQEAVQKLMYCAEHGIPIVYTPCDISGGTAPATLAGVLVQNLAETLPGIVLSQLLRKGTPVVVGGVVSLLDMRTTTLAYGAPELALLSAAATEVAYSLGLPMFSTAGCTDAKCLDEQAAIEGAISIVFAALSGANLVHDVGYSESAMTGSLEQLVMCDEIIGMARHIARGIRVDEETLAVDAIAEAAEDNTFIALDHTVRNFRREFWFPKLMDRTRYGEWEAGGQRTMRDRVRERINEVIEGHRAPPLAEDVTARLDQIVST